MLPEISVIVPVWNRERLIRRCLDSILDQRLKPKELIVVDNGSTDNTVKMVENWMRENDSSGVNFKLLIEEKRGACAARQKGLENAEGDFVIFFDSDDAMLPELIQRVTGKLKDTMQVDIVCWRCKISQLSGTLRVPPFMPENPVVGHLLHTLLRPQGYMVRKEFLINSGGWKKPIEVWNDLELGLRLLLNNPKILSIREVLALIYSQEDSITGKDFSSKEGKWEFTLQEMERDNYAHFHPRKEKIRKILNYRRSILAAHYFLEGNKKGAANLMNQTLKDKSFMERRLLKFSFHFTRIGLRGVWRLVRFAY